jgi:hypothetical protein
MSSPEEMKMWPEDNGQKQEGTVSNAAAERANAPSLAC